MTVAILITVFLIGLGLGFALACALVYAGERRGS